jgi:glycopeptide antibiotics resistance protein
MHNATPISKPTPPDIIPPPTRVHVGLLFLVFLAIAIYGSLVPFKYVEISFSAAVAKFQAIPFLKLGADSRADWVANLLLFMPLGFLGIGFLRLDAKRSWMWSGACFLGVVIAGCLASCTIEFCQLWFPNRTVSQNDIFAETLGAALGASIWLVFGERWLNQIRMWLIQLDPGHRLDTVLFGVLVLHLVSSTLPLDITIHPRELWEKYKQGKIITRPLEPYRHLQSEQLFDLVLLAGKTALIGWLAARIHYRRRQKRIGLSTLFWQGLLFNAAVECMQLFIYSRTTDINHVFVGTFGFVLGGWLLPHQISKPINTTTATQRWGRYLLCVGYLLALLCFFWYPFRVDLSPAGLEQRTAGFFAIPFAGLYQGSDYHAMEEIIRKLSLFALLVLFVGLAFRFDSSFQHERRPRLIALFLFSCAVGLLVEGVQIALPDHYADNTDVLLYVLGSGAGCALLHYLFPPLSPKLLLRG